MTAEVSVPSTWGPPIHSHERMLWVAGPNGVTDIPIPLEGHGLDTGSPELSEAITYTTTVKRRGRIIPVTITLRSAIEMSVSYDIGIPAAIWTPAMQASYTGCIKDFFLEYVCPTDSIYRHFIVLERGALTPAIEANGLIVNEATGEAVRYTTTITVERRLWGWGLGYRPVYAAGGTIVLNGISFIDEDCPDCDSSPGLSLLTAGGDGTAAPTIVVTDDRFTTTTTPSAGSVADVAYATFSVADVQLVSAGDDADPSAATTANVYRSIDGGTTYVEVPDIDIVVYKFISVGDDIMAVGVTVGGAASTWISTDRGNSFTELVNSDYPAAEAFVTAAYDKETLKLYFGGASGSLFTGRLSTTGLSLTDITANLGGTPTAIAEVVLLDRDNLVVAGAAGVVKESWDGAATFSTIAFPTTAAITCAAGNKYRLVLGSSTKVYQRSFLTRNRIVEAELEDGAVLTGNVTDVAMNVDDDFNRFAVCTDDGEVALGLPFYPTA